MSGLAIDRRKALAFSIGGLVAAGLPRMAWAEAAAPLDETRIDAIVQRFMAQFGAPGIAVAVVRPGAAPFLKGYGVRTQGKPAPVDVHTRFGIASNSKSFTAALLAQLVDAGTLAWEDPVIRHLPEFKMYDPAVTQMMTVRDLLVHRSGLALGQGDLMMFPTGTHQPEDVLKALPYLKPARGFRAGYAYDNILYIVAGLLIARVTGKPWTDNMAAKILAPLGMADAVPAARLLKTDNVAGRHARLGPPLRGMGPMEVIPPDEGPMVDAAGGINASVTDIAKWLQCQLDQGKLPDGKTLFSTKQSAEMWTPQVIVATSNGPGADNPARAVTTSYALGWGVGDYRGERLIAHSGGLSGQVTQTALLPARGIGVAVFSNTEDNASGAIRNSLLDLLTGAPAFDWAAWLANRMKTQQDDALKALGTSLDTPPAGAPSLPLAAYAGRYRDPWYGDVVVTQKGGTLAIDFTPTPVFKSALEPWGPDAFRTRFAKGAGEDAVISFAMKDGKVTGVTMKALSPLADFSYDFHDLAFVPVAS